MCNMVMTHFIYRILNFHSYSDFDIFDIKNRENNDIMIAWSQEWRSFPLDTILLKSMKISRAELKVSIKKIQEI